MLSIHVRMLGKNLSDESLPFSLLEGKNVDAMHSNISRELAFFPANFKT
jgi:hypothetical protein